MRIAMLRGYSDALLHYGLEKTAINWSGMATGARNLMIGESGAGGRFFDELKNNKLLAPGGSLRNQLEMRHSTTGPINPKTNAPSWKPGDFNKGNLLNHALTVGAGASQIMNAPQGQGGSSIGGAIGSTLGGILGTPFGMVGQTVAGTLGGMAGEGLGSIFNKKTPTPQIAGPMTPKAPLAAQPTMAQPPLSAQMSRITGRPV